jgi:two-component system sporulation sensor kinase B
LKDFLLNILFIFFPLIFYPYVHKFKPNFRIYRFLLYLLFSLSLIISMSFPVNVNGVVYDLRSVPLALGSLYGGPEVGFCLFFTAIFYRYAMEYPNPLLYAFSLLPSLVMVMLCYRKFSSITVYKKIALSVVVCTLIKLITITVYLSATNQFALIFNKPADTLKTYLLQAFVVGSCVYLIEFLNHYYHMQEELIKNEKANIISHMAASMAHEIRIRLAALPGGGPLTRTTQ